MSSSGRIWETARLDMNANPVMEVVQTTLDGLLVGAAYALIALGFSLIFGVMKRINLAYGSCLLLGGAVAVWLEPYLGWGVVGIFAATVIGGTVASVYVERLCFAPHSGRRAATASMISSFAVWMQLDEISSQLLPRRTHDFPGITLNTIEAWGLLIRVEQLLHLLAALALMGGVFLLLYKSRFGLLLRAASENIQTASLLGCHTGRLGLTAFALAGVLGGVAAFLILSNDSQITPLFGLWSTFKGLVAMMLGGMGSIPGAILGGLLLGVLEAHVAYHFGAEFRDIATFALLFLILLVRPGGLFGKSAYRTERNAGERL